MDTPEQSALRQAIQNAQERYEQDGNEKAYLSAGLYLGVQKIAEGYGNHTAKMVLTLSQHVIKGTVETLIGRIFDPRHGQTTREGAIEEMLRHTGEEFLRDLEPLKAYLAQQFGIKW